MISVILLYLSIITTDDEEGRSPDEEEVVSLLYCTVDPGWNTFVVRREGAGVMTSCSVIQESWGRLDGTPSMSTETSAGRLDGTPSMPGVVSRKKQTKGKKKFVKSLILNYEWSNL